MLTPSEIQAREARPVRLQLSRKKGFDLQAHSRAVNGLPAVNVARPSIYGNPWTVQQAAEVNDCRTESAHRHAVDWFREWITNPTTDDFSDSSGLGGHLRAHTRICEGLAGLRGKNLACFCRPGFACHADVLLELANGPVCEALPFSLESQNEGAADRKVLSGQSVSLSPFQGEIVNGEATDTRRLGASALVGEQG